MSTLTKVFRIKGMTLQEAWKNYRDEDVRENGEGTYNGTINHVSFPKLVNKLPETIDKRESAAVCIRKPVLNTNKVKSTVENFPCKDTRKWETYYYARPIWLDHHLVEEISDTSQAKCIEAARKYVEKHPNIPLEIHVGKRLVNMDTKVAKVKYKPASNESPGEWECIAGCPY